MTAPGFELVLRSVLGNESNLLNERLDFIARKKTESTGNYG